MPIVFTGELNVEPDNFFFYHVHLIIHQNHVNFRFLAEDYDPDSENWSIDGNADFQNDQTYDSGNINMTFTPSGQICGCQLRFTQLNLDMDNGICNVEGTFIQMGHDEWQWQINGELNLLIP